VAGGSVGYYMDVQEAKLRQRLRESGVSVTRAGNQIILNMPGNVTFKTNSADISADFYEVLNSVAVVLNEYKNTSIDVVGHTDSVGSDDYNQRLSEHRARSVAEYLAGQRCCRPDCSSPVAAKPSPSPPTTRPRAAPRTGGSPCRSSRSKDNPGM
jgi:outer membrane protein OmpA-like peptidoglycan-associated protein